MTTGTDPDRDDELWSRETAPQSPYTAWQIGIGLVVLVVGLAIAIGLPLLSV